MLPELTLGGFSVLLLIPSTVEFFKDLFSLEGKVVTGLSFVVGALYSAAALAVSAGYFAALAPYLQVAVGALVYGLNAAGYWKLVANFIDRSKR